METLSDARKNHLAQPTTDMKLAPDEETMPQTAGRCHLETRGSERPGVVLAGFVPHVIPYADLLIVLGFWAERSLANTEPRQVPDLSAGGVT